MKVVPVDQHQQTKYIIGRGQLPKSTATTSVLGATEGGVAESLSARFKGRARGGVGRESYAAGPRLGSL